MAVRTGMANLIARLRGMTDAGTADFSIGGETYWSDDHLQTELDLYRRDIRRERLQIEKESDGGTVYYRDYYSRYRNFEEASGGSAVWRVENSNGDDFGTVNYTPNYEAGHLRMSADTGGTAYYLTARAYNLRKAAADVWRRKAANAGKHYDFSADGQSLKRSQFAQHCLTMAEYYDRLGGLTTVSLSRGDTASGRRDQVT